MPASERWKRVEALYHATLQRPLAERATFLREACADEEGLRHEVESLLAQPASDAGFLATPALAVAARAVGEQSSGAMLAAGHSLGSYTILGLLGAGGMGEVYRARDSQLGRDVAIKMLPAAFLGDPDRLARFERESRVLASLNHPNIAAIYAVEPIDAGRALVLELVEGPTLAERIARGPVPLDEALRTSMQIAEALDAAHEKGIVHRDLKPANIKRRPDGTVKVLDFGLAKAVATDASSPDMTKSPTISAGGTGDRAIGTPAYMSPEQSRGQAVDKRTDIWAFGCVLFEMLTGRPAFAGPTVTDTLAAIIEREPDWASLAVATPAGLQRLLRRCLEKNPKQRWHSAADVRIELEAVKGRAQMVDEPRQTSGTAQRMWKRALPVTASLVVAALGSGYAVWMLKPEPPRSVTRFVIPLPEGQQFTDPNGQLVAISPDGTNVVYVANQRLYLRPMSGLEARAIPGGEGDVSSPAFSPDGRTVAFYSVGEGALKRLDIAGGAPVTIAKMDRPYGLSWSGQDIVFSQSRRGILRVPSTGAVPEMLAPVSDEIASSPQMLPGRRGVLFSVRPIRPNDQYHGRVVVQPLDGGVRKTLVEGGIDGRYLPTGHLVYAISGDLFAVPFDVASLSVSGGAVNILEGIRRSTLISSPAMAQFSYSATGSLAFLPGPRLVSDANVDLALFDRKGKATPLGFPPRPYRSPRVSPPDGKFVAFDIEDANGAAVWVYELAGGRSMQQLTFGGKSRHPMWSPDGQWVAFQSDRNGDLGIFRQRADGSGVAERLTKAEGGTEHVPQSWSKDGGQLLFSIYKDKMWALWTLSMKDRQLAPFGEVRSIELAEGAFSPDGQWVAYRSRESEASPGQVFLQPFPATGTKYLVRNGSHVHWSPRGDELLLNAGVGQSVVVPVTTSPRVTFGQAKDFPRGLRREGPRPTRREVDSMPDGEHVMGVLVGGGESLLPQINIVLNWFDEVRQRVPKESAGSRH